MPIEESQIMPVLDNVIDFVETALMQHEQDQNENRLLREKIAQQDRIILEKVASQKVEPSPIFTDAQINGVLGQLEDMHLIARYERVKLASELRQNPSSVLNLLTKISAAAAPSDGVGVPKEAADNGSQSDPDGWFRTTPGRRV